MVIFMIYDDYARRKKRKIFGLQKNIKSLQKNIKPNEYKEVTKEFFWGFFFFSEIQITHFMYNTRNLRKN